MRITEQYFRSISLLVLSLFVAACGSSDDAKRDESPAQPASAVAAPVGSEPGFAADERLAPPVSIPLREGLTIVTAVNSAPGDYESIKRVESVSASGIRFTYSAEHPSSDGSTTETRTRRDIRGEDLANARVYRQGFSNNDEDVYPGSTALGVSALVLTELRTKGSADVTIMPADVAGMLGSAIGAFLGAADDEGSLVSGTLSRVESVSVPVIVNDAAMLLPGMRARGRFEGEDAEFVFLDNSQNPIALRWRLAGEALQVIKISFPAATPAARVMAEELRTEGRTEVHGIYFDFGSAVLRPESEAALRQIADALGANREWRVRLDGHTDSIGTAERNQALSEERAAAVKTVLVSRFDVAASRLSTAGHGATQPKAPNDSLVGRARNRRVELVREGATE